MKIKFIWFDSSRPVLMTSCFRHWCARAGAHPSSVQISMLTLWKEKLVALILPLSAFSAADLQALAASTSAAANPPPPSQQEFQL